MATLSALFGHEAAIKALRRALGSDSLAGAYLFSGPAGVGKGALAQAFAAAAACRAPRHDPFDACGECPSCRMLEAGAHPEIVTITPAGESMQIWQFWDRDNHPPGILSRTLSYAPSTGRRHVYILEQADTLSGGAANSLLKALEEPPPYALFVLLAPHVSRMLPTIVSRCQIVRLNPAPVDALTALLQDRFDVDPDRAAMLASFAEGRIGQAVRMARNPAVGEEISRVLDFAETLPRASRVRALKAAEQMRKLSAQLKAFLGEEASAAGSAPDDAETGSSAKERVGRRQLAAVFDLLAVFYRDLLVLRVGGQPGAAIVNRDRQTSLEALSEAGEPGRWTLCIDALLLARRRLDANANIALVTEALAMALIA